MAGLLDDFSQFVYRHASNPAVGFGASRHPRDFWVEPINLLPYSSGICAIALRRIRCLRFGISHAHPPKRRRSASDGGSGLTGDTELQVRVLSGVGKE